MSSTTLAASWGRTGLVSVAVSGQTIVVGWISDSSGTVRARVSTDAGATWSAMATLATGSADAPSMAAVTGRVGLAWSDGASARIRLFVGGAWLPAQIVPVPRTRSDSSVYQFAYSPKIALIGSSGVGVAWSECAAGCDVIDETSRTDLLWSESSTNGATWSLPQQLSTATPTYGFREDASLVWVSTTTRFVLSNASGFGSIVPFIVGTSLGLAPAAPAAADGSIGTRPRVVARAPLPHGFAGPWGQEPGSGIRHSRA